jgi:hypothetical protein
MNLGSPCDKTGQWAGILSQEETGEADSSQEKIRERTVVVGSSASRIKSGIVVNTTHKCVMQPPAH